MPAISGNAPDLSVFPTWQLSGQWLAVGSTPAPVPAASVPPGLPIGAVLGLVAATGAYTLCDPAVTPVDGSQVPAAVLASQASLGPPATPAMVWPVGQFSTPRLFYSNNWSLAALIAAMGQAGLLARTPPAGIFT